MMVATRNTFGDYLRELLEQNSCSQQSLAFATREFDTENGNTGLTQPHVSSMCDPLNDSTPKWYTLMLLSQAMYSLFGVRFSPDDIFKTHFYPSVGDFIWEKQEEHRVNADGLEKFSQILQAHMAKRKMNFADIAQEVRLDKQMLVSKLFGLADKEDEITPAEVGQISRAVGGIREGRSPVPVNDLVTMVFDKVPLKS